MQGKRGNLRGGSEAGSRVAMWLLGGYREERLRSKGCSAERSSASL